jgi:hypothetical protein
MINEKITLRTKPLFEFEFSSEGFQVTDDSKDNTNRFYEYLMIKDIKCKLKSINWFSTLLNWLGFLHLALGDTELKYDGYQIRFNYGKEEVIILTENCEFKTVMEISEKIKSNISNQKTQY